MSFPFHIAIKKIILFKKIINRQEIIMIVNKKKISRFSPCEFLKSTMNKGIQTIVKKETRSIINRVFRIYGLVSDITNTSINRFFLS